MTKLEEAKERRQGLRKYIERNGVAYWGKEDQEILDWLISEVESPQETLDWINEGKENMKDTEILELAEKFGFEDLTKKEPYGKVITDLGMKLLIFAYHLLEKEK